jgi:acyl carrier protein
MREAEVKAQLRDWIAKRAKRPVSADFSDETPVLQTGILTSLDIVEFVLFIESLRGTDIEADAIEPEAFTNVRSVYSAFFASL